MSHQCNVSGVGHDGQMSADTDPVEAARRWRDALATSNDDRDASVSFLLHALLSIIDDYQADEAEPSRRSAYPTTSYYTVETLQPFGGWEQASGPRKDLPAACEKMEALKQRFPDARLRVICWDKQATVVALSDEERCEEGDTRREGGTS